MVLTAVDSGLKDRPVRGDQNPVDARAVNITPKPAEGAFTVSRFGMRPAKRKFLMKDCWSCNR